MVAVALSGIWVMYGKALAKSAEVVAANGVARSVAEGLTANGWIWLKEQESVASDPVEMSQVKVERVVRGRRADITFYPSYRLEFNTGGTLFSSVDDISPDVCRITVDVQWRTAAGGIPIEGSDRNARTVYSSIVYRHGL